MNDTILDFLDEVLMNNGIFNLNVEKNSFYKRLKSEKSLDDWRVTMAELFFSDYESALVFMVSVSGKETRCKRIAKEAVKKQGGDWIVDAKVLMNVKSMDEVRAIKEMISLVIASLEKTHKTRILFCNEYDNSGRIYLGVYPQVKEDGKLTEIKVPGIDTIFETKLQSWQKRFAKDLRSLGRYSFSSINASGLYGKKEVFKMLGF